MSAPRVSVVVAAWNAETTIAEAIESLLAQTFNHFEVIVVDDGSSDRTGDIARRFGERRVRLLRNETNRGLAAALNVGLRAARGEFIARQDADDRSPPRRLERQVAFLDAEPEVGFVGTAFEMIGMDGRVLGCRARSGGDEYVQRALLRWNPLCAGSVLMRRTLGEYDERFASAEDYDLWLRLAERARAAILPDVLYQWRVRPDSITHARGAEQARWAATALRCAWQRRLGGPDALGRTLDLSPPPGDARRLLAEHCAVWARETFAQRRWTDAARLAARALRLDPSNRRLRHAAARALGRLRPGAVIACAGPRRGRTSSVRAASGAPTGAETPPGPR